MSSSAVILSADARLVSTLEGLKGPVLSLAFSFNGKYLASGGADGIRIWDLEKNLAMNIPRQPPQEREQVCAICWLPQAKGYDIVCYGNSMGYLVFLECQLGQDRFDIVSSSRVANGREIVCITSTPCPSRSGVTRIALGTRDQCIQIWSFKPGSGVLTPVQSKIYEQGQNILPKALAFDNNSERDLHVFGLIDGGLYKYEGNTVKNISKHQLGSQIGNAVVDIERRICVVDNVINGFDAYQIDSGAFIQDYRACDAKRTQPKGVVLGDKSRVVIGGSDHGKVYIFNRKTGGLLKTLNHRRNGGVEIIAANDSNDGCVYVASASSTMLSSVKSPIHIWKLEITGKSEKHGQRSIIQIFDWSTRIIAFSVIMCWLFISRHARIQPESPTDQLATQSVVSDHDWHRDADPNFYRVWMRVEEKVEGETDSVSTETDSWQTASPLYT